MPVDKQVITIDHSRDALLTQFGKDTLSDRYLMPGERHQDLFARVAAHYADDAAHAQRLYDYMSKHWFMPATPVLSNGGTSRGLPISCLTGEMLVNVPDGVKAIRDIRVGDRVLTHKGRFRHVVATASRRSDEVYELSVRNRRTRLRITGNHPVLTIDGWKRVDALSKGRRKVQDRIAINRTLHVDTVPHTLEVAATCPYETVDAEGVLTPVVPAGQFVPHSVTARVSVDAEMAWAIGLFLAEGGIARNNHKQPNGITVTMNIDERCYLDRFADIIERRFGVRGSIYEGSALRGNTTHRWLQLTVSSRAVGEIFQSEFGHSGMAFRIPEWVLGLELESLECFMDAFIEGDGCVFNLSGHNYTTIGLNNPQLIGGLYNVALRLGMDVSLKMDKASGRLATVPVSPELRIFNDGYHKRYAPVEGPEKAVVYSGINKIEKLAGSYEVFDIQVEDDESFSVAGVVVHNCFLNEASDSLEGIVNLWVENVWLAARGGGIGSYWGNLRSIGERVGQVGKTSGVVPFIKVMDSQTLAISQGSLRRGSAAVYLPISHPEIEEFIEIRRQTGGDPNRKALNLHHGVVAPDAFMRAVESGAQWTLRSPKDGSPIRTVSARTLWQRVLTARLETGEPYILFSDAVNDGRPDLVKLLGLPIKSSNLCSEVVLPTGLDHQGQERTAVCCLSSLNLEKWHDWRDDPLFIEDVMRFLDNVLTDFIEKAPHQMERAVYSALRERSVGMGVMGFHGFLQAQSVPFESLSARSWNKVMFKHIRRKADQASRVLATERGPCLDAAEIGIHERFTNKLSIAPTASISIIAGGASPGIEPIPTNYFAHKTLSGTYGVRNRHLETLLAERGMNTPAVWSGIANNKGSVQHLDCLTAREKEVFKTAFELDQRYVIQHAADRTPFICQSQSVNLFLPADIHKRDLHQIHMMAWKQGLKSLYYCRSMSLRRADAVSQKVVS